MTQIFEAQHNQKFDTHDQTKPWRIVVVNAEDVVFVYHHSIGDGICGYPFHRSLLKALNADESVDPGEQKPPSVFESSESPPLPCSLYEIPDKLSWPYVIYNFLFWTVVQLLINQKQFLFSDAVYPKTYPTVAKPFTKVLI